MTTKTPVNEIAERVLKSHGWALGPEFWQRVTSDPFVFQLVAVIEREAVKTDELRSATRDLITARAKKAEAVRNAYPLPFYEAAADGEREAESRLRSLVGVEDTTEATPDA